MMMVMVVMVVMVTWALCYIDCLAASPEAAPLTK